MEQNTKSGELVRASRLLLVSKGDSHNADVRIERGTFGLVEGSRGDGKLIIAFEHGKFETVRKTVSPMSLMAA